MTMSKKLAEAWETYERANDPVIPDDGMELYTALEALKLEKRRVVTEFDYKIAQIQGELADRGLKPSQSAQRGELARVAREAKVQARGAFEAVVAEALDQGMSVPEISRTSGCANLNILYGVRNRRNSYNVSEIEGPWDVTEQRGLHRYAMNAERKFIRYLDEAGNLSVWAVEDSALNHVQGSYTEEPAFRKVMTLLELLSGNYTGPVATAPNPYAKTLKA